MQPADLSSDLAKWDKNPITFFSAVLRDPENGTPFKLNRAQRRFLLAALKRGKDGKLIYPELIFSAPKKSGKTTLGAMFILYVILVLGGKFAEAYTVANDEEQSQGRVFAAIVRIIEASPMLRGSAHITQSKIAFPATGATITAISSDYASAAGANPTIICFDELWAYSSERARRLWDEMCVVPTRKISVRLTTTYAGFSGESKLLEDLYKKGIEGKEIGPSLYASAGLLMAWHHEPVADWQTPEWVEQMRSTLRPNAFLRLIENRWVSGSESFVPMEDWDACVDPEGSAMLADPSLQVWLGIDASTKRDSTAIVACTLDTKTQRVRAVFHRIFQPSAAEPLDFEKTIEATVLDLRRRFWLREVRFDPYQMTAVAQRLTQAGIPMLEWPQTVGNITEASSNLFELIKSHNLSCYPSEEIRLAMSRAVAVESPRGWKIDKSKAAHKIDVVVAMAMAALGAIQQGANLGGAMRAEDIMLAPSSRWSSRWAAPSREARSHQEQLDREDGIGVVTMGSRFGRRRGMY